LDQRIFTNLTVKAAPAEYSQTGHPDRVQPNRSSR